MGVEDDDRRTRAEFASRRSMYAPTASVSEQFAKQPPIPARCWECGTVSEPRPLGKTPEGWGRTQGDQGGYLCPECWK